MNVYQTNVIFRPCAHFGTLAVLGRVETPAVIVLSNQNYLTCQNPTSIFFFKQFPSNVFQKTASLNLSYLTDDEIVSIHRMIDQYISLSIDSDVYVTSEKTFDNQLIVALQSIAGIGRNALIA